jgi:sodium-dependent phosphate transporter
MPALPQFDYIFAIATIFAFLDAWNIGTFTPGTRSIS